MSKDKNSGSTDNSVHATSDGKCCGAHATCNGGSRKPAVLIVDDDPDYLELLAEAVSRAGQVEVYTARGPEHALGILRQRDIAMIVSDHFLMTGMTGTGLLETAKDLWPDVVRVLITARPSLTVAVGAINRGKIQAFVFKGGKPKFVVKQILQELPGVAA